jgi:hypothetical protein
MKIVVGVALILIASPSLAQTRPASWWASHPSERNAMRSICQENIGQSRHIPNCANAFQGDIIAAERDTALHTLSGDPRQPSYWLDPRNADQRRFYGLQCSRPGLTPSQQASLFCPAIRAAGG